MHLGEHAAHAPAAVFLDRTNACGDEPAVAFEHGDLAGGERLAGCRRQRNHLAIRPGQRQHVSRERVQLVEAQVDDLAALLEPPDQPEALGRVGNSARAQRCEARPDRQQHIRVIDRAVPRSTASNATIS